MIHSHIYIWYYITAAYYLSCDMFKMYTSDEVPEETMIDPDGSGPLKPFKVTCSGKGMKNVLTIYKKH